MPNARDKAIDGTHLSIDTVEDRYLIHRDYIAHCFRWSHACKVAARLRGDLWVLDIGCGREMPLAKMLYTNKIGANKYCGVDYNRFEIPEMLRGNGVFPLRMIKPADAAKLTEELVSFRPTLVTMFEVFEHVEPEHGRRILDVIAGLMRWDGTLLFSTPCFNGNPAGNHVAEPEYEVMGATLEDAGFAVVNHWGTFASIKDYRDHLFKVYGKGGLDLFEDLKTYYDSNTLAVMFAPVFPERARNCLWECVLAEHHSALYGRPYERRFPTRLEVKPIYSPTGSSSLEDAPLAGCGEWLDRLLNPPPKPEPCTVTVEGDGEAVVPTDIRQIIDTDPEDGIYTEFDPAAAVVSAMEAAQVKAFDADANTLFGRPIVIEQEEPLDG